MSHKLEKYIKDIEIAAKFFEEHFVGKEMIYSTQNESISLKFNRSNFMHLCGVQYSYGANKFFKDVINHRIDINKISVKSDGTTYLKLSSLKSIHFLLSNEIKLTGNAIYLDLFFDKSLRTGKQIFALTLINEKENRYFPNSFLNLKSIKNFPNGQKVISIKSIHLQNKTETIYL